MDWILPPSLLLNISLLSKVLFLCNDVVDGWIIGTSVLRTKWTSSAVTHQGHSAQTGENLLRNSKEGFFLDTSEDDEVGEDPIQHASSHGGDVKITIVNYSSTTVSGDNFSFDNHDCSCSIYGSVLPGQTKIVCPYNEQLKDNGSLQLLNERASSVTFDAPSDEIQYHNGVEMINIQSGATIRIIDDTKNVPLDADEFLVVDRAVQLRRENGLVTIPGFEAGHMNEEDQEFVFWKDLASTMSRKNPIEFKNDYMSFYWKGPRYDWYQRYQPMKAHFLLPPARSVSSDIMMDLVEHLSQLEKYTIHAYWRSLDKSSGSWEDELATVRYTFEVFPAQTAFYNASAMVCLHDTCYEEINCYGPYPAEPILGKQEDIHDRISELLLNQELIDATCHVEDTTALTANDPDSDWSSIEILVFESDKHDCSQLPLFRLHRDCRWGPQHSLHHQRKEELPFNPPSEAQIGLIDFFSKQLVDIGQPDDWTWSEHSYDGPQPISKALRGFAELRDNNKGRDSSTLPRRRLGQKYCFPMYFRWC